MTGWVTFLFLHPACHLVLNKKGEEGGTEMRKENLTLDQVGPLPGSCGLKQMFYLFGFHLINGEILDQVKLKYLKTPKYYINVGLFYYYLNVY